MKVLLTCAAVLVLLVTALVLAPGLRPPLAVPVAPPVVTERAEDVPRAPVPTLFSALSVGLSVHQSAVSTALDAFLPRTFSGVEEDPIGAASDDRLEWSLDIGNALVWADRQALAFRVPIDRGVVTVTGRIGAARKNKGALGWLERIAGFDFKETIEFQGAISGTLRPSLRQDWTIDPQLNASVSLSKAEAELFGRALKISFRDAIKSRIEAEVGVQTDQLRKRLASDGRIVTAVQRAWEALHAVVELSSTPPIWMSWQPVSLAASDVTANKDQLQLTLGGTVQTAVSIAQQPPEITVGALPPPSPVDPGSGIIMRVPVSVRLEQFNNVSPSDLGLSNALEHSGGQVAFKALSVYEAASELMTVAVDVVLEPHWSRPTTTRLYVSGRPVFERSSNRLYIADAHFDANTIRALVGEADTLLEPFVLKEIERRSVFEILETEEELLTRARAELDLIESVVPEWIDLDLAIDSGRVERVIAEDGWLVAILEVTGSASVRLTDVEPLLATLKPAGSQ